MMEILDLVWAHRPSLINHQTNTGGSSGHYTISTTLPEGLSFGTNNGTIYGTDRVVDANFLHGLGNNSGSSVAYLNITVVDELPTISYTPATLDLTNNTVSADLPLAPTITGAGEIAIWEIQYPALLMDYLSGQPMEPFGERQQNC